MKKLLSIILSLVMLLSVLPTFSITAFADGEISEGSLTDTISYSIDQNGTLILQGTGEIDDYYAIFPVSGMKRSPFCNNASIKYVTIGEGITNISASLFYGCANIEWIQIPNTVTTIVCESNGLSQMTAFSGCDKLTDLFVDSQNPKFYSDDGVLFNKNQTELLLYGSGRNASSFTIPNTVSKIGKRAFYNCKNLVSVVFPKNDSFTVIDSSTFYGCSSLQDIEIPQQITTIGSSAFCYCTSLNCIEIPKCVSEIGSGAFSSCSSLTDVTICNSECSIYESENVFPSSTIIRACSGSTAQVYANTYSRSFESIGHQYEEIERVEPASYTENGYVKSVCSICGNEKTAPLAYYKTHSDSTRFASNEYILPVAKSCVYNGRLYARIDKPLANFNVFSSKYLLPELTSSDTFDMYLDLISGGPRSGYLTAGIRSGDNWINKYSQTTIDSSLLKWNTGEPNNSGGSENAISIITENGLLNDISDTSTGIGFLITTNLNNLTSTSTAYYQTNKYLFYKESMPFSYAQLLCEAKGGHLATVSSSGENIAINSTMNSVTDAIIGGCRNSNGDFEWVTGEPFSYANWASGEPNNTNQPFINMYASGLWDDDFDKSSSNTPSAAGFVLEYEPTLSVSIKQDGTHSISDSEIHILANYPDGTSNDITNIATFTKTYLNGYCEISVSATKPNGETIKITEDIEVEGEHSYTQRTVTEPTCTKEGKVANICTVCKARYDETVPANGHDYHENRRAEATCTNDGFIQYTCNVCGDKYRDVLNATEHNWNDWGTVVEATELENGMEQRTCSNCNAVETREIVASGHNYVFSRTVNPTCTEHGYDELICTNCNSIKKENITDSLGHNYIKETVPSTCTNQGYSVYRCSRCEISYTTEYTNAIGHSFGNYTFNNDSTELFAGTETATCTRCAVTDTRNICNTTIYSEQISVNAGEDISIPIYVKNNAGFMGFALEFEYDSNVLTPVSVTKGNLITSGLDDNLLGDAIPGKFKAVWYGTENLTENGILMYLNFTVNDKANGETTVETNYLKDDTFNEDFEDVEFDCNSIQITILNETQFSKYHGALTATSNEVTAGDTFCVALDTIECNVDEINATANISFDNNAFTFLGYADANKHLVQTDPVESTGAVCIITNSGRTYNVKTPGEIFEALGIEYLVFKANDYASSGVYDFGYDITNVNVDDLSAEGCTIKINPSATSEIANVYIENGLSGEYTDVVTVPINISNNKGIMGYMINIEYNSEQLEIVLAQRGSSFPGNFNDTIGIDEEGQFSILWNGTDNIAVDGVLMNLTFRVLTDEDVISPINITYSQDDTFNSEYEDVVLNCTSGSIHLNEEENHDFLDEIIAPTPNTKGYTKHTCINCGYSYNDNETDYANDMGALIASINKVADYSEEDYSAASYAALQAVYARYLDYPSKSIPQTTIDEATTSILTAISNLVPYLFLTVKTENGTVTVNDYETTTKYSLLFGDSITLTAVADEGYVFDGWYETVTKRVRSSDSTITFKITSNTDFEARFVKEETATLSFESEDGWVAGKIDKTVSEWSEVTNIDEFMPKVPYKLGFTNGRWVYDSNTVLQKLRNGESVVITPEYDSTDLENPIIPTPIGEEPALDLYYQLDEDNNVGSFVMAAGFPDDCHVESIGIAFYYKKAADFNPANFDLTINNKLTTSKFVASNEDGIYTVDVTKFTSYYNWAARGYVTYYDSEGKLKVAYSNQINVIDRQLIV